MVSCFDASVFFFTLCVGPNNGEVEENWDDVPAVSKPLDFKQMLLADDATHNAGNTVESGDEEDEDNYGVEGNNGEDGEFDDGDEDANHVNPFIRAAFSKTGGKTGLAHCVIVRHHLFITQV